MRLEFDKDIEVVDVFEHDISWKRYVEYYLKPNVSIRIEKTEKSYKIGRISLQITHLTVVPLTYQLNHNPFHQMQRTR